MAARKESRGLAGRALSTGVLEHSREPLHHHTTVHLHTPVQRGAMQCFSIVTIRLWPLESQPPSTRCRLYSSLPITPCPAGEASLTWVIQGLSWRTWAPSHSPECHFRFCLHRGAGTGRGMAPTSPRCWEGGAAHRWSRPRLRPSRARSGSPSSPGSCSWPARPRSRCIPPHPA